MNLEDMKQREWRHKEKGGSYLIYDIAKGAGGYHGKVAIVYHETVRKAGEGVYFRDIEEWHDKMEVVE